MSINLDNVLRRIEEKCRRSAWSRGVAQYAEDLIDGIKEAIEGGYVEMSDLASSALVEKAMLNGAQTWEQFSWGGCSLVYDFDICERLCTPTERKKTDNGFKRPNKDEEWLDVQARALHQAAALIKKAIRDEIAG